MWLRINNSFTEVAKATNEELDWIDSYLSFKDNSAAFRKGKSRFKPLKIFDIYNRRFPTGLVPAVFKAARKDNIEIKYLDQRVKPSEPDPNAYLDWLRDYQKEAVYLTKIKARGIFKHGTGAGKGITLLGIVRYLKGEWLFLVNSVTLVNDIANRWEKFHKEHYGEEIVAGRIGEGVWQEPTEGPMKLWCATIQSIHRYRNGKALPLIKRVSGLIVDEVHGAASNSYYEVINMCENAYYRYGFSATPLQRGDKKSVFAVAGIGPVIHEVTAKYLIDRGFLTPPEIKMVNLEQNSDKKTFAGVYGELIVKSNVRNNLIVQMCQKVKYPALCFVKQVKHGKILEKKLQKAGVKCKFIWGDSNDPQRQAAIKQLVYGDIDVLVVSTIFDVGVDIPSVESLINAAGGKSVISALQKVGRGMRKAEGKKVVTVYDIFDKGHTWMENHSKKRLKAYLSEEYKTTIENTLFGILT